MGTEPTRFGDKPRPIRLRETGDWYEDIKALRRRGCFIERDGDVWRLDLDTLPEMTPVDAGRVVTPADSRAWEGCDDSSGSGGEETELTLGIDGGERRTASPYDPMEVG